MKVLVTGHLGYIGTVLVPMLQERGYEVAGMDTDMFRACTFSGSVPEVRNIGCDVRDARTDDLRGFDAVIHLAGLSNDPLGDYDPELTYEINYRASVALAEKAKAAKVRRFLFASSCSNYGGAGDDFLDEDAEFNPVTPYGESKVLVERDVAPMGDNTFSPTFLRASTAYGLSPRIRFDLVVNNLTAWAFTTGKVMLKSDGTPWRPLVHVWDIALAYCSVLEADPEDVSGKAFNVGTTCENYQIREVAEIVGQIVPDCQVAFADGASPDKRNYRVNCDYIARSLHEFKPQWTVRRGVTQLYESYRSVGLALEDFEGKRYKRIDHVKELVREGRLRPDLRWAN